MKHFTLIFSLFFVMAGSALAQKQLPATIFIIDMQTGAQQPSTSMDAINFENALITLVSNTQTAKLQTVAKFGPGRRSYIIQQLDPQANGDAYQITLQRTWLGTTNTVYTFQYNVDQNKLYFLDDSQQWIEQMVQGVNLIYLSNCYKLGAFNAPNAQPQAVAAVDNSQQQVNVSDAVDDTQPVDENVTATVEPPAIPEYEQPECPQDGFLWQPGYWAYSNESANYYWVPGVWVAPPTVGFLWTPPYWGFEGGIYAFHAGYWGNTIGFYGGIDYGFGYGGVGFVGGEWRGGRFAYNREVVHVSINVRNVYADARYSGRVRNHVAYNGGRGGINARPNAVEMRAMREKHVAATPEQIRNQRIARSDKAQFAGAGGRPGNLAAPKAPEKGALNGGQRPGGTAGPGGARPGGQGNVAGARPGAPTGPGGPGAQGGARPSAPGAPGNVAGTRPGAPTGPGGPGGNRPVGPGAPAGPGGARPVGPGAPVGPGGARPAGPGGVGVRPAGPGAPGGVKPQAPKPQAPKVNPPAPKKKNN